MATNFLGIPELTQAGLDKYLIVNDANRVIDSVIHDTFIGVVTTPPGSPVLGGKYLIAAGATGILTGRDGQVLSYYEDDSLATVPWIFDVPIGTVIGRWRTTGTDWVIADDFGAVSGTVNITSIPQGNNFITSVSATAITLTVSSGTIYTRSTSGTSVSVTFTGVASIFRRGTNYFLDV